MMMKKNKVVCFGEMLVRLPEAGADPNSLCLEQTKFGGSEANVAVSLAQLGDEVIYVTRLPDNKVGHTAVERLHALGVDTSHVAYTGNKIGSYFLQQGASRQKSVTVYDRDNTAFSTLKPGDLPWRELLADAAVFHTSGISAAISQSAADAMFEAIEIAQEMGVKVSVDINYRKNLWQYGAEPRSTLIRLMQQADIMFGDAIEFEYISDKRPVPFEATSADFYMDLEAYSKWLDEFYALCPRCGKMIMGIRSQPAPTHHVLTAILLDDGHMLHTRLNDITNVIDPVGVGDAFSAGSIHAALHFPDDGQKWLEYALSAATLKNQVPGDFNLSTDQQIMDFIKG